MKTPLINYGMKFVIVPWSCDQLEDDREIPREGCSQKMGQNLQDCCNQLDQIAGHIEAVELEAGRIAG